VKVLMPMALLRGLVHGAFVDLVFVETLIVKLRATKGLLTR
jgi:hypothetical protein